MSRAEMRQRGERTNTHIASILDTMNDGCGRPRKGEHNKKHLPTNPRGSDWQAKYPQENDRNLKVHWNTQRFLSSCLDFLGNRSGIAQLRFLHARP